MPERPSLSAVLKNNRLRTMLTLSVIILLSLLVCFLLATREAEAPVNEGVIDLPVEGFSSRFVGLYGEALLDAPPEASIAEISGSKSWQKLQTRYIGFGAFSEPIWLRVKLRNVTNEPINVRFDTRRVAFKSMKFYLTPNDGETVHQFLNYSYKAPFSERPVNHRILVADAELKPNEQTVLYVHYEGLYNSILPMRISHPGAFERADKHEVFWASSFYGLIGATFFLTIITWWLTGWRLSISFGVFLIASLLSVWSVEGYVDQLVIPTKNAITAHLTDSIYLWTYGAILLLSRNLFDVRRKAPVFDRVLVWSIVAIFGISLFHLFIGIDSRNVFVPIALTCRVSSMALHASVGIWAVYHREKGATIFTMSAVLLTIASAYMVSDETFGFPYGGIPFTLRWLITIEVIAFATAIVLNVAGVKQERDRALVADLRATQEKLRLNEALRDSQSAYETARLRAYEYRNRLQSVSHDILQPLGSLKAALEENVPQGSDAHRPLNEAFEYLQALANNNLSAHPRKDAATKEDEDTPVELVLQAVQAMFAKEASKKGLELNLKITTDQSVAVPAVPLMRAVSNLVANAIKYTPSGSVTVLASNSEDELMIDVSDTGPGLSQDEIDLLTKRGLKGPNSNGSGLGLSIVQEAMDALEGELKIHASPGAGTRVCCKIPIARHDQNG